MSGRGWTGGRVTAMVLAGIIGLIGSLLALGGVAMVITHAVARDDDGFFTSATEALETDGYAITSEEIDLGTDPADWAPDELLGDVRIQARSEEGVFVGIAPAEKVDAYLSGVAHAEIDDFLDGEPTYVRREGGPPPAPPAREGFWVASTSGTGEQSLSWPVESGLWSIVAMNADGSRGVALSADIGVEVGWLLWLGLVATGVGAVLLASGIVLILSVSRRAAAADEPRPQ